MGAHPPALVRREAGVGEGGAALPAPRSQRVPDLEQRQPGARQELWRETHNVELQVLSELGLVGFGIFVWLLVRSGNTLFVTWNALRPRRRRGGAALADPGFAPHEREWMRAHVAACVAGFAGWLVSAQFGSIGYHWTLYYVVALGVAAHEILVRRMTWSRGGVAHGASPA